MKIFEPRLFHLQKGGHIGASAGTNQLKQINSAGKVLSNLPGTDSFMFGCQTWFLLNGPFYPLGSGWVGGDGVESR